MRTLTVVDLFAGAGGATQGLRKAGYLVLAAVENDRSAAETYGVNHPETELCDRDIQRVQAPALARRLRAMGRRVDLLTACPPCQPFSTLGSGQADDPRNALVSSLRRFVVNLKPRAILVENVPGLRDEPRLRQFLRWLGRHHTMTQHIVQATDYGIPQQRRRMIVVAIRKDLGIRSPRDLLAALPATFDTSPRNAGQALRLAKGLTAAKDPVHRARTPRPETLVRIRAVPPGGGRFDLPQDLQLACHSRLAQRHATSIYGRIDPTEPAPTMTTRCTTPSCGRFVHPTEDRGLSLREAALLQTFPPDYQFRGTYGCIERQIGNAVPPRLAEALGLIVAQLLGTVDGQLGAAA